MANSQQEINKKEIWLKKDFPSSEKVDSHVKRSRSLCLPSTRLCHVTLSSHTLLNRYACIKESLIQDRLFPSFCLHTQEQHSAFDALSPSMT